MVTLNRKSTYLGLNPDAHWSRAYYKILGDLQAKTPRSLYLGRDDQSGFRLDTTATHRQFGSINTKKTVTTRTDFVNKKATVLQVTNYNFPETPTFPEVCIGIVKASYVHEKNPAQHMADLEMLEGKRELGPLFANKRHRLHSR